jgi:hypothetical protein
LRIQIVDEKNRPMFDSASSDVKPYMRDILREIGKALNDVDNRIACPAIPTPSPSPPATRASATGSCPPAAPTPRAAK